VIVRPSGQADLAALTALAPLSAAPDCTRLLLFGVTTAASTLSAGSRLADSNVHRWRGVPAHR
jgi:hypothetical protein